MSQDNPEPSLFTLNPLYLKAALDEVDFGRKAKPEEAPEPSDQAERPDNEKAKLDNDLAGNRSEPANPAENAGAAIATKQAEIARIHKEIDELIKIKDRVCSVDLASCAAELNELRFKRVAIQMALVSGSDEYNDGDLLALDRQIAELVKLMSRERKPDAVSKDAAADLNAKIGGLQSELEFLTGELRELIANQILRVAVRKAEDYVNALKVAHNIRHELLALAALGPSDGPLRHINLGGELPRPWGFQTFASILADDLAITAEGVEEAKARIRAELAL